MKKGALFEMDKAFFVCISLYIIRIGTKKCIHIFRMKLSFRKKTLILRETLQLCFQKRVNTELGLPFL